MPTMKNNILELVYDKLMDNTSYSDKFDLSKTENAEIDYERGTISFDYTIGKITYKITLKLC
jgi:hypothetical protein